MNNRSIPIPGEGNTITQLGHVSDLTDAMILSLENKISENKIYNCSGKRSITFKGIIEIASCVCSKKTSELNIVPFDYSHLDSKSRKLFPLRIEHFFTDISLLENDLNWTPSYDIESGFIDSFNNDYLLNPGANVDFSLDKKLIGF